MIVFLIAFNKLMENRSDLIEDCLLVQATLYDTSAIDAEIAALRRDLDVVSALARKGIAQTAKAASEPDCSIGHLEYFRQIDEQITRSEANKRKRLAKRRRLNALLEEWRAGRWSWNP